MHSSGNTLKYEASTTAAEATLALKSAPPGSHQSTASGLEFVGRLLPPLGLKVTPNEAEQSLSIVWLGRMAPGDEQ